MRKIIDLNFNWKYSETFTEDMLKAGYDDSEFDTVDIPHTNKELPYNYFDESVFQFVSCYRKSFRLPAEAYEKGKHIFISFEGAANFIRVYLNGSFIGMHKGAYTPFSFEITDKINRGINRLAIMLDSTERKEIPPFGNVVDYLVYGGIYREVHIDIFDEKYIRDVFVKTPDALRNIKTIEADVAFSEKVKGNCVFELFDGEKILGKKTAEVDGKIVRIRWKAKNVELWDISSPKLYELRVTFGSDSLTKRFGFREAKFTKTGFYLNGKKLKLIGLNRHQSYPYVGNAMPASAQRADADFLKFTLGCNIVRTSHYPDSVHFLDRCDEIGLLVFTEMPGWQYLGKGEWRDRCLENIRAMIVRDRSHPSVALWGVRINESGDCDEFYKQTNALAHSLDPSRQTGGVRNFPRSRLFEDVYTYNDFIHSGSFFKLLPAFIVCGLEAPYLVTEYNGHMYPTKSFDREQLRTEQALRHLRIQNASFGSRRHSGAIGWCMSDYNTHKDFGSGDRICYHGVADMFRIPKLAAAVYSSQQDETIVLETSSSMDVGEYPGSIIGQTYIFTNCDYVKVYRNGKYKSTAYPAKNKFPNLPHPPVLPVDFIGDSLEKEDGFSPEVAVPLKNALTAASSYGFIMPPQHYLEFIYALLKGKTSINKLASVVTKYFANWGDEQVSYRFDGYKDGVMVKSVIRAALTEQKLSVSADCDTLIEDATYDVTRIEIISIDQNGNRLPFANNSISVSVSGPVRVLGPSEFALIGGARAFWVRSIGKSGDALITIKAENLGKHDVRLKVIKK